MNELLRKIPKVDELLRSPALAPAIAQYGDRAVTEAIRAELEDLRREILSGQADAVPEELCAQIAHRALRDSLPSFRSVINGTGIILHTNLGRACLSEQAAQAVYEAARSYSNLEYDLQTGKRGSRYSHVEALLCRLTGAEGALVVNNNAAAVLLVLSALTQGGQVIVSRGELVEIGGSFRIPEIMESCGAQLKEVGATNKTHLSDYERAIGEGTRALMKVHTSNYRIIGFSETPALSELVALGHRHGLPVLEDLGSGSLLDLKQFGIHDEPTVQESVRAGVDVVSFSGDKLLGGPQAGIILGKKKYMDILKKHPLNRAMRVDKMTLAALEATLRSYDAGAADQIPVAAMLAAKPEALREKAECLAKLLAQAGVHCGIQPTEGRVGGGSVPNRSLPSYAVAFGGDVNALEEKLRSGVMPIVGRIHEGKYLLDVRTLMEKDFDTIADAVREALA
ncbi:MAG: L-seryl-tRNA(Sec) selenium transferase [Oscillospiraceae bacterium]|nr:L-seryl-tRNA(Sec) selenium transferase [Oscillospiraceae bacterium]